MDQEMSKRTSVPGYVPCVELSDPEFRKSCNLEDVDIQTVTAQISHDTHGQVAYINNNHSGGDAEKGRGGPDWKPNDYVELSVVACIFNFVFGLVALALSLKSQEKWTSGRRKPAKCLGICSMVMSILAIISTALIIFLCLWYLLPRDMSHDE